MREIPVYLFTGFLEAGKTTFIQETLEEPGFNSGERTLLLLCEEGEEEYSPERFASRNVFIEIVEDEEDLTAGYLEGLLDKHRAERVIVEYNGMWLVDSLYLALPEDWLVYQEFLFLDSRTILIYNENMRQLVYDKLKTAEMIVFKHCDRALLEKEDADGLSLKMRLHKLVRAASRKNQIVYEFGPDDAEPDMIPDPLPFDINAPVITVNDGDYAEWYRDINEHESAYDGKEIHIKGRLMNGGQIPADRFVFGRHVMTCCVEDIQFAGFAAKWTDEAATYENGQWIDVRALIRIQDDELYVDGRPGPVLFCSQVTPCDPADPEVAQF